MDVAADEPLIGLDAGHLESVQVPLVALGGGYRSPTR
jgi:hypothetical protein